MNYFALNELPTGAINTDRFIPLRKENNWQLKINLMEEDDVDCQKKLASSKKCNNLEEKEALFTSLLKNEILGTHFYDLKTKNGTCKGVSASPSNVFTYSNVNEHVPFNSQLPAISPSSQKLLRYRSFSEEYKISPHPSKILDAPDLLDDFYLNLLDWSSTNVICIALSTCIYLWSCAAQTVTLLCDIDPICITSVAWHESGNTLAIGTDHGSIHLWDIESKTEIRKLRGHTHRVNVLSWNQEILTSGGINTNILHHNINIPSNLPIRKLTGHDEDVCGLKWSPNKQYLASGGNDNCLCIWDIRYTRFIEKFTSHSGAIKALAWSPHDHGIIASGGGAQDRSIRIWNIQSGKQIHVINTGSQVCNLTWSQYSNDFLSTHGIPNNDINVWNYPRLARVANLTGHATRVLYLASSPNGHTIATAGSEELRFWEVFNDAKSTKTQKSALNLFNCIR